MTAEGGGGEGEEQCMSAVEVEVDEDVVEGEEEAVADDDAEEAGCDEGGGIETDAAVDTDGIWVSDTM